MTEQTQTTAERLLAIIGMNYTIIHDQRGIRVGDHSKAAAIIAAEIDRLMAERDAMKLEVALMRQAVDRAGEVVAVMERERDEARADLAKCGADLQYEFDNPGDSRRRIAELEAQLAEARAMLATIRPAWFNDDVRPETLVETCQRQAAEIDALTAERDAAQRLIGIYGTSRDAVIAQLGTEIDLLTAERDAARRIERMAVDGRGRENVARITHEVWSMWMRELCKVVSLPEDVLCRLQTPYHNLPADDQASCLAIADDYIRAIGVPLVKIANDTRKERDEAHLLIGKQSDELIRFTNLANDYATASQKLAEARAEVERLRPLAEERQKLLDSNAREEAAWEAAREAAARARAAKGEK